MTEKLTNKSKKARRVTKKPAKNAAQKQAGSNDAGFAYDKLETLKEILQEYSDLYEDDPSEMKNVLEAYKLEKPLSGIEIYGKSKERALAFMEELREIFFISICTDLWEDNKEDEFDGEVFVSRFHSLVSVAKEYKLTDDCADLAGILYGRFSITEIAGYCLKLENRSESPKFGLFK